MQYKFIVSATVLLGHLFCQSCGVPLRAVSENGSRSKRDGETDAFPGDKTGLDFPANNYDYEFSDVGDIFDYLTDPSSEHSTVKRYSDAMATDRASRFERLKLLKARQSFLKFLLGASKRSSDDSLAGLLEMLKEKRGSSYESEAMAALKQRLGLLGYPVENSGIRARRHTQGLMNHRQAQIGRTNAALTLHQIQNALMRQSRSYEMPDWFTELMAAQSRR